MKKNKNWGADDKVGDKFYFQEPTLTFYKVIIRSVFQNHLLCINKWVLAKNNSGILLL
jgi:hypothetical protein